MNYIKQDTNLILIGMPGVGKSTVGVLLAKVLNRDFIDTDVVIQSQENRSLQQIIQEAGREKFCELEERYVLHISDENAIIATGGSVVYSDAAMKHLAGNGIVAHLDAPLQLIEKRVQDVGDRGVVMMPGQSLEDLYRERQPLYRRWADITVDTTGLNQEEVLSAVTDELAARSSQAR